MVEAMSGSRRFLLLLLVATLTCVVVVQVTLDGWNFRTNFPNNGHTKEMETLHVPQLINHSTPSLQIQRAKINSVTRASTTNQTSKSPYQKLLTNITKPSKRINQTRRLQTRSGKDVSRQAPKQLISKNERLQEILKQSNAVRGRSTIDPMRTLKSIPLVKPENVKRIIVITYFRAGSSFFGDLLQQNWKTFYHFEPLHYMTYNSRIGDEKVPEIYNLFDGIFSCNFTELKDYMAWVKNPFNQFLFAHNTFLWATCHGNPKVCFNSSFVTAVCRRAPIHVMKVTRLHMRHLRDYLEINPDLGIKVVYLTRDPRGIVSSRWTLDWCNASNCSDPKVLCHEMDEDLSIFNELHEKYSSNFIKIRYEDLSLNPEKETEELFQFLKLPYSTSLKKFLKSHTVGRRADDNNPYSTRRNTTSMAYSWRERFTFKQVQYVQSSCGTLLRKLNHTLITSQNQLPYPNGQKPTPPKQVVTPKIEFKNNPLYQKLHSQDKETAVSTTYKNTVGKKDSTVKNQNNTNIEIHKTYKMLKNSNFQSNEQDKFSKVKH